MIQLNDLHFTWPGRTSPTLIIPQWHVAAGERVFLHGPSGCGKSTLLNVLAGLLVPQRGNVEILQTCVNQLSGRARDHFRARHIGLVFQQFNLIPYLDVETNIRLSAHFSADRHSQPLLIEEWLDKLMLPRDLLRQPARQLSMGQQQRVALARALINKPRLVIADEPTSALDRHTRDAFIRLLLEGADSNETTLVFVSHDDGLAHHFSRQDDLQQINRAQPAGASIHAV